MEKGATIEYVLTTHRLPVRWRTEIERVDELRRGVVWTKPAPAPHRPGFEDDAGMVEGAPDIVGDEEAEEAVDGGAESRTSGRGWVSEAAPTLAARPWPTCPRRALARLFAGTSHRVPVS